MGRTLAVGFLNRKKNPEMPPPQTAAEGYEPKTPNSSLGPFGGYESKSQFMVDWAADIFRQADRDPSANAAGIQDMATIAAFTQLLSRMRAGAISNNDRRSVEYLDAFDRGNLLPVLDTLYPAAIRSIAEGAGCRDALMIDRFVRSFDGTFDEVFNGCRGEFVEGVLKGDF
jgi:hypothetical protein